MNMGGIERERIVRIIDWEQTAVRGHSSVA